MSRVVPRKTITVTNRINDSGFWRAYQWQARCSAGNFRRKDKNEVKGMLFGSANKTPYEMPSFDVTLLQFCENIWEFNWWTPRPFKLFFMCYFNINYNETQNWFFFEKFHWELITGKIGNNSLPWKGCIIGMQLFTTHNDGCKSRFPGIAAPPVDIHCAFHAFAFVTRKQIPLFYKELIIAIVSHRITRCNLNPRGCSDCCR